MFIFGLIRFIVKATYLYCCEMWRMDYSSQARRLEESPVTYFRSKEKHEDCETPCKICGECSCKEEFFIQNMAGRVHENCLFLFVLISSTQLKGWSRKTHEEWVFPGRGSTAPIEKGRRPHFSMYNHNPEAAVLVYKQHLQLSNGRSGHKCHVFWSSALRFLCLGVGHSFRPDLVCMMWIW